MSSGPRQLLIIIALLVGLSALAIYLGPQSRMYGILAAAVGAGLIGLAVQGLLLGLRVLFRRREPK